MNASTHITAHKIVAIIRGTKQQDILPVAEALYRGGVRSVEVTLNTPDALQSIAQLCTYFNGKMLIGAGTVLTPADAADAVHAGAAFIISPIVDPPTIATTRQLGVLSIPGAYTATEIVQAHRLGADIIKVFPAGSPAYIKDLRGPLSHIPLMPTGGISLQNIGEFMLAGAIAFGIGSALVDGKLQVNDQYLEAITHAAQSFVQAVNG